MRIGHLISQYPTSSHTFIRREVQALRARGLDVHTFSVRPPEPAECVSQDDRSARDETFYILTQNPAKMLRSHTRALLKRPTGYVSTLLASLRHRVPGARSLAWSVFYFAEAIVLSEELEKREITHLHNHFANPGANVGYLAARFLELPWSLTLHGISETDYPAGVMLPGKLVEAAFVACVSYFGRAQAMRLVPPSHWDKMFIGRCALDLSTLPPRAERKGERLRIICVGRLSPEKGHVGLLDAFKTLKERGSDAELVLVGDGPERFHIEQAIRDRGLGSDVQVVGRMPERETLMEIARSDILVLASFMEGLPVVLMEAMALKVPVIASRVAGTPELVEHGKEGLLFTPGKWSELADALQSLAFDETRRAQMGEAGRAKIEREFEIGRAIEPLVAHLVENAPKQLK